jgi:hypothetical protein
MKRITILCLLLIIYANFSTAQDLELLTIFDYPDFRNTENLKLLHDARITDKKVRLTAAIASQKGGIWYTKAPIQVDSGFTTEFSFQISAGGVGEGADGFAFIIHNSRQNLSKGINGGGMGYDGIPNCIAVEFDTYDNDEQSNNHISVQTRGREPNRHSLDASIAINRDLGFDLKDSRIHKVKISYQTGTLDVFVDNMRNPILTVRIDIARSIDLDEGRAWVGISGATGEDYANHDILKWSMQTTRPRLKEEPTKPVEIEHRKIDYTKSFTVDSREITIKVWDHKKEDGDIISLNLDGNWIVQNYALKKRVKEFKVNLSRKENFLVLHALNLGSIAPNTAAITIIAGTQKQTFILSSDMKKSQALTIVYNGE